MPGTVVGIRDIAMNKQTSCEFILSPNGNSDYYGFKNNDYNHYKNYVSYRFHAKYFTYIILPLLRKLGEVGITIPTLQLWKLNKKFYLHDLPKLGRGWVKM